MIKRDDTGVSDVGWTQRALGAVKRTRVRAGDASRRVSRIPAKHPEGYLEAFPNMDAEAARAVPTM